VQNAYNLQRLQIRTVHDEVRKDAKEPHISMGQIPSPMSNPLSLGKESNFVADDAFDAIRGVLTALLLEITPNLC
jgi:hypothetical protein